MSSNDGVPTRQRAVRTFANEFNDSTYTFKESDDDRAPVFQLLRTGEKANRVFFIGTLTQKRDVSKDEDDEYWQGRIVDPTGTFFVYAGQYQPEAEAVLREVEAPAYLAVVGKPRTYENDEGDIITSIRPESINVVDAEQRDRWVAETAEKTLNRIEDFDSDTKYIEKAREVYGEDLSEYLEDVTEALTSLKGKDENREPGKETNTQAGESESEAENDTSSSESGEGSLEEFEDEINPDAAEGEEPPGETDGGQTQIAEASSEN